MVDSRDQRGHSDVAVELSIRQQFRQQRARLWTHGGRQIRELILLGHAIEDRDEDMARSIVAWLIAGTPFRWTDMTRTSINFEWLQNRLHL